MILAFDTSSGACTAALFDASGALVAWRDEQIGRGHAERLVPMIAELMDGRAADRILVGVGPGSFTGIRVGIAAAHGLAIGWGVEVAGMSSLALLAAGYQGSEAIAAAVLGGHGELFVQQFAGVDGEPLGAMINCAPGEAAISVNAKAILGSGAQLLVGARGWGEAVDAWPSARHALQLAPDLRDWPARPLYARAPDARPRQAA